MLLEKYVDVIINVIFSVNVVLGTRFVKQRTQDLTCSNSSAPTDLGAVANTIACSRSCSTMSECRSFYFNEDDGACWGSNQTECQTVPGTVFYRKESQGTQQTNTIPTPGCASAGACPAGWYQICNSCYIVTGTSTIDLVDSTIFCQTTYPAYNAYMFQLETAEEDVAVVTNILQNYSVAFCLGLHDPLHNGVWEWIATNEPMTYSNWLAGQPNSATQYYVYNSASDNYQWRDFDLTTQCRPLCEISLL